MTPYYTDESVTIYHGDCRELLPDLPKDALMLTDPPFGIDYKSNWHSTWQGQAIANDADVVLRDYVLAGFQEWCCFGSYKTPPPPAYKDVLVWDKGPASGMGDLRWPWKRSWELVFLAGVQWVGARDEGVIKGHLIVTWETKGRMHPNGKPASLFCYLMGKHSAEIIIDPFMGSGTTLRAAKDMGRRAIGIEIDERYCEIAAERMRQQSLFQAPVPVVQQVLLPTE